MTSTTKMTTTTSTMKQTTTTMTTTAPTPMTPCQPSTLKLDVAMMIDTSTGLTLAQFTTVKWNAQLPISDHMNL